MLKNRLLKFNLMLGWVLLSFFILNSCASVNVFSLDQDRELGMQLAQQIAGSPNEYPLLDRARYPEAYNYLQRITDEILNSGQVRYRNEFDWKLHIIRDDRTLNAFVTPGGYIYVYTGLIKYLDTEDQLAGVMGHEIAHADRRHSTNNLTKQYGTSLLVTAITGSDSGLLSQLARGLIGLKFSRSAEQDADKYSVIYLSKTRYQCNGAAGFFEKILQEGNSQAPPTFLSTHPSSDSRVADINKEAKDIGCNTTPSKSDYQAFKRMLP